MTSSSGAKRATLAQVADLAGVSLMTASYTYNKPNRVSADAKSKVLAAAAELGYAGPDPSARSLRRGRTGTIGVVFGEHLSYAFEDPQAVSFLAGVADVCAMHGYGMTILPTTGAADDVVRVRNAAVDGFIVWTMSDDNRVLAAVQETKRPAVVHGGPSVPGLGLVSIDNRAAAHAVGSIAFAGAKRPAILSFPLSSARISTIVCGTEISDVRFPVTRDRLEGYREAVDGLGIAWREVIVAVCARNDAAEAERVAARLLSSPEPPDAIAAMSDVQAAGTIRAVLAAGLSIPDDVAVTGWDDTSFASQLGLTTVAQSIREQGMECARIALGQQATSSDALWSIVRRDSTQH